jgi:hypothetical protein
LTVLARYLQKTQIKQKYILAEFVIPEENNAFLNSGRQAATDNLMDTVESQAFMMVLQ